MSFSIIIAYLTSERFMGWLDFDNMYKAFETHFWFDNNLMVKVYFVFINCMECTEYCVRFELLESVFFLMKQYYLFYEKFHLKKVFSSYSLYLFSFNRFKSKVFSQYFFSWLNSIFFYDWTKTYFTNKHTFGFEFAAIVW